MMEQIFEHTIQWLNGEWTEGIVVTVFGIVTIMASVILWQFVKSPAGHSLVLPILICGVAYSGIGVSLMAGNHNREGLYRSKYEKDPVEFVKSEKQRVEGFQYTYVISKTVATVFFLTALLIFWFTNSPVWQGWGIGMALFGLTGLIVDYFSQHRAFEYYDALTRLLAS